MKTSSKNVITFLQRMSGRKILLIMDDGSMDFPKASLLKSFLLLISNNELCEST